MEAQLKINFPNYKIYDASNKSSNEMKKIEEICENLPQLIVFMERNEKNKDYLKYYEHTLGVRDINWLFINKGNCMSRNKINDIYLNSQQNHENIKLLILSIKKFINNDTECCICFEKIDIEKEDFENCIIDTCENCSSYCCRNCIFKYLKVNDGKEMLCPVCRKFIIGYI